MKESKKTRKTQNYLAGAVSTSEHNRSSKPINPKGIFEILGRIIIILGNMALAVVIHKSDAGFKPVNQYKKREEF